MRRELRFRKPMVSPGGVWPAQSARTVEHRQYSSHGGSGPICLVPVPTTCLGGLRMGWSREEQAHPSKRRIAQAGPAHQRLFLKAAAPSGTRGLADSQRVAFRATGLTGIARYLTALAVRSSRAPKHHPPRDACRQARVRRSSRPSPPALGFLGIYYCAPGDCGSPRRRAGRDSDPRESDATGSPESQRRQSAIAGRRHARWP